MMPATAASAAPITKVSEIVRSTSTPSSDAIFRSCSQARMCAAEPRLATSQEKPAISTSVVTTTMIWTAWTAATSKASLAHQRVAAVISGGSGLTRAPCAICT